VEGAVDGVLAVEQLVALQHIPHAAINLGINVMIFKIFSQFFATKLPFLTQKQRQIVQNFDHNIGF
jgi:hypothetical protein